MQSRAATSFFQRQLLLKSKNAYILPSGVPHRLLSIDLPCDLKGNEDVIAKKVTHRPLTKKLNLAMVEKEANPFGPLKQPLTNSKLGKTNPPQGHHKFQKCHFHISTVLGKEKPKPKPKRTDEEVVVWMPEQMEHPEETMIRRPKEIWERNRMRGDPHSPQSKIIKALRGEEDA